MLNRSRGEQLIDPSAQGAIAIIGQRKRLASEQADGTFQCGQARIERQQLYLPPGHFGQGFRVLPILRVVDKGANMHLMRLRQMLEQMEGANLVPLIGRIGDAVHEIEKFIHPLPQMFHDMRPERIRHRRWQALPHFDE